MSTTAGAGKSDKDALVSKIYATTLAPENYDALMEAIESFIGDGENEPADSGLDNHFQIALDILNRMGRRRREQEREYAAVHSAPGPAYVIDATGRILTMNDLAKANFRSNAPELRNLKIEKEVLARLLVWMENEAVHDAGIFIEPVMMGAPAQSNCLMVRRLTSADGGDVGNGEGTSQRFFVTTIELHLDPVRAKHFLAAYDLTKAEMDVAVDLTGGASPNDIAEKRSTSINTVRAQVKSVLRKTNTASTPDLVRLLCGFSAGISATINVSRITATPASTSRLKRRSMMTLSDGRQLFWLEQGDLTGAPVICIHNMLYGVEWTDAAVEAAAQRRLRIISPSRPGFGDSDLAPAAHGRELLDTVANDIVQLMDHLDVHKAIIMGHVMGSIYALRFALRYPSRAAALFAVSNAPIWREEWLATLPKRQRIVARITRQAPHLLPFVTRAGIALFDAGFQQQFVDALHKDIPADARALKRRDVYDAVMKGFEHTNHQGGEAFRRDCPLALTDFSSAARALETPFQIIYGDGDELVPVRNIELFADLVPETNLIRVKGAGQYLLFSHWQVVLKELSRVANSVT
jgi:pimeloyl-ACP methyl ester carboxylesterase/DNA-binding CsgD family transcriptional regulator